MLGQALADARLGHFEVSSGPWTESAARASRPRSPSSPAAAEIEHKPRSRGSTASQISMPAIVEALNGTATLLATRPSVSVAGSIAIFTFTGTIALYAIFYVLTFFS